MDYPKGTWTKQQWIEVVSKSEVENTFGFEPKDLEGYGRDLRDYKLLKKAITESHGKIIEADIATLTGPFYPEGAKWLSKRQAKLLLEQLNSLIFNANLVKRALENVK